MKKWWILCSALILVGCASMTERQKQTAWIVAGVVVAAVIISDDGDNVTVINEGCHASGKSSVCGDKQ